MKYCYGNQHRSKSSTVTVIFTVCVYTVSIRHDNFLTIGECQLFHHDFGDWCKSVDKNKSVTVGGAVGGLCIMDIDLIKCRIFFSYKTPK